MGFGQVIIGPPGSGKTVYCNGMSQYLASIGRKVSIVNLDPSNENIPYECAVNIQDLIDFQEVVEKTDLGPNGGLIFCMEYLEKNIDWLKEKLLPLKDHYILFDCPGQVELYTHYKVISNLLENISKWSFRLTVIQIFDSFYCKNPSHFISILLVSLSSMVRIELPHVNVLSKMDLIEQNGPLDFQLDYYTDVLDLSYLNSFLDKDPRLKRFSELNKSIAGVIEDFSLVNFIPLNIMDKKSVANLIVSIDKSNGYIYGSLDTNTSIMEIQERETQWNFDKYQEVQEAYYQSFEDDDVIYEHDENNEDEFSKYLNR
ncbi:hypothetical protein DICPUDRAFT_31574 [Dictyostelium purpureum]|uniref:GPN-loop GTPase 2 n=1 Tax=Dictyostelium purpureum TaxID=5786 RepID=F0ZHG9_DICPU|nr:uncharacterized protein DICPUDRAFT_31574 [Dictyostelium purpureum]EGC36613.1 hypothetical protein DICPUDRAFT_31574 [Dictyostelium purpureum]|eukprot:XP_003286851.1 hypothetical protein DICPUDRAFT_31574 [Dictyostelium purpureum]